MKTTNWYTTQLQAGLGLLEETRTLLELWEPGMDRNALYRKALDSAAFPNVTARRLQNVVTEGFAPRYLADEGRPAAMLKRLVGRVPTATWRQILFLFSARAHPILYDFVQTVYWPRRAEGHSVLRKEDARRFIVQANQEGKTRRPWSESTIRRLSNYLTGCCADFGLLRESRKADREFASFRMEPQTALFLAYDLHFSGYGDTAAAAHSDWRLFGLEGYAVVETMKRLAYQGHWIVQSGADLVKIGWVYTDREALADAIIG